jgi:hypothetical protein
MHERRAQHEHGIFIRWKTNGNIAAVCLCVPGTKYPRFSITTGYPRDLFDEFSSQKKRRVLFVKPVGLFAHLTISDQWLYDYGDISIHRTYVGHITESRLLYPCSKLVHHTIAVKNGQMTIDPPIIPEPIDYID